jgi:Uma2 family endonuclease
MVVPTPPPATLDDPYRVEGKAELIAGRIVHYMASGDLPAIVAGEIYVSLREYVRQAGVGVAYPDGIGFAQRPPLPNGRESFSPDASYYTGPRPHNRMRFIDGPPDFAAEVRSENDYGPSAEAALADERADYFAAGTRVVWDVDPLAETVAVYRADAPTQPTVYRRGDVAEAEPAVPGWRMPVDALFS